jgi:hypothetical protein
MTHLLTLFLSICSTAQSTSSGKSLIDSAIATVVGWALLLSLTKDAKVRGAMLTHPEVSLTKGECHLFN